MRRARTTPSRLRASSPIACTCGPGTATSIRRITPPAWRHTTGFFRSTPTSASPTSCAMRSARCFDRSRTMRGYRMPRVSFYLGRWMRTTDMYPDYQLRLYDRRQRALGRAARARVGQGRDGSGRLSEERAAALSLPGSLRASDPHGSVHDARGAADVREGQARDAARAAVSPADRVLRATTSSRAASATAKPGLIISLVNSYYVMLKFAKLWELSATEDLSSDVLHPRRHGEDLARRTAPGAAHRARAARAGAPDGARRASRRRARRTRVRRHDLIRLAPRAEVDLHAGWKLSRIIKDLRPDIVHAHDPHAVAAGVARAVVHDVAESARRSSPRAASRSI